MDFLSTARDGPCPIPGKAKRVLPRLMAVTIVAIVSTARLSLGQSSPSESPASSDPYEVLQQAYADAAAGRFEAALAKHIWFHDNSLKHDRSFGAVRHTYALTAWKNLGDKYAPAREKLLKYRDAAKKRVLAGEDLLYSFADFDHISRVTGDAVTAVELFLSLHESNPKSAKVVYDFVEDRLIEADKFELCSVYMEPDVKFQVGLARYEAIMSTNGDAVDEDMRESFRTWFRNWMGNLIMIRVKTGEKDRAMEYIKRLKAELNDPVLVAEFEELVRRTD